MNIKIMVILTLILAIIFFIAPVKATNIVYDNITTINYAVIKVGSDNLNIGIINDYNYEVYINNNFLGNYKKGDNIYVPDNSYVYIWIPSPIKTNIDDVYTTILKPTIITFLGFALTWGLLIVIILIVVMHLWKTYIRR